MDSLLVSVPKSVTLMLDSTPLKISNSDLYSKNANDIINQKLLWCTHNILNNSKYNKILNITVISNLNFKEKISYSSSKNDILVDIDTAVKSVWEKRGGTFLSFNTGNINEIVQFVRNK